MRVPVGPAGSPLSLKKSRWPHAPPSAGKASRWSSMMAVPNRPFAGSEDGQDGGIARSGNGSRTAPD